MTIRWPIDPNAPLLATRADSVAVTAGLAILEECGGRLSSDGDLRRLQMAGVIDAAKLAAIGNADLLATFVGRDL